jgi:hypothetical protein
MELASCQPSGADSFDITPILSENLYILALVPSLKIH